MKPCNRLLLVEPINKEQKEKESFVLVPETYKKTSLYISAKVVDFAEDCKINVKKDQIIVIDNSMLQEVEINEKTNFLILENYVMGVITDS
jgi:co-chaperonin GroES (HSP10)